MIEVIPDIQIFGVYDRGAPNTERIVLRVNRPMNLASYFLILGFRGPMGVNVVIPIPDSSLWLGATSINVPSWIFVFTGNGKTSISQEVHSKDPVHCLYWNRPNVVLTHDDIVPALIHVDSIEIGNKPNKTLADVTNQQNSDINSDLMRLFNTHG